MTSKDLAMIILFLMYVGFIGFGAILTNFRYPDNELPGLEIAARTCRENGTFVYKNEMFDCSWKMTVTVETGEKP